MNQWERIGKMRRAGILVPLFSVYSKESLGIGDFLDLKLLIDWAKISGNSIVQLLPMNEMSGLFCPYDALSAFALEPLYLSLSHLKPAQEKPIKEKIKRLRKIFPAGRPYVDYGIKAEKIKLLREIYQEDAQEEAELEKFKKENAYWLKDFALFKVLKNHHQQEPWYAWSIPYRNRQGEALEEFSQAHREEIAFEIWLQYTAFCQFKETKEYAAKNKVLLKGDLPILVSRDSADVWSHPEYFKLEFAAGAPPDMYAALGQRWGMPTYNWEEISRDAYRYLKEKLRYAQNFYDILRIDHVIGLFRIWSIPYQEPEENKGLNGSFDPQEERLWEGQGRQILSVILNHSKMLICAEDLGLIPEVCPKTLAELAIPGNDVQRWNKDWKVRHDFLKPQEYRLLSVAMLSTHDTTNWPAWWENEAGTVDEGLFLGKCRQRRIDYPAIKDRLFDPQLSRHARLRWKEEISSAEILVNILGKRKEEVMDFIELYQNSYQEKEKLWRHLGLGAKLQEKSSPKLVEAVLKFTLEARSIFSIHLITDWLYLADIFPQDPYQYRINTPGTVKKENWSLVLPLSLEELLRHKVSAKIRKMLQSSGRSI